MPFRNSLNHTTHIVHSIPLCSPLMCLGSDALNCFLLLQKNNQDGRKKQNLVIDLLSSHIEFDH